MSKKLFDFAIGNPPYQESQDDTSDKPVYNYMLDAAYEVCDKAEFITPARFLFNAGKTPKSWNEKMLNDDHFKVLKYYQDAQDVFPNTSVNGGVVITYRDASNYYGKIITFSRFNELNTILSKVREKSTGAFLDSIISQQSKWNLENLYSDHPELKDSIGSKGRERRLTTAILTLPVFHDTFHEGDSAIIGLFNGKRRIRYIPNKYLEESHPSFKKWKVLISSGDGAAGTIGLPIPARVSGTPFVLEPHVGFTQTFISFGAFDNKEEACSLEKYLKTKVARTMLATLKITQHNHKDTWANVPLQDFSNNSDIDWSKTIHDIDLQLYRKYDLSVEEINFIETHVKEMI